MDFSNIKELITLASQSNIEIIRIDTDTLKIEIHKNSREKPSICTSDNKGNIIVGKSEKENQTQKNKEVYLTIYAPIAGTFNILENKETSKPFSIGDRIFKKVPICSIEAMKNVNLVNSEYTGLIHEILVKESEFVEYDQPLFMINTGNG